MKKSLLLISTVLLFFFDGFSQVNAAHKLTYEVELTTTDSKKSNDVPWYLPFIVGAQKMEVTFYCFKKESISFSSEETLENIVKNFSFLDKFNIRKRDEELLYSLSDNNSFVVKRKKMKNSEFSGVVENFSFRGISCKKMINLKNTNETIVVADKYPCEWGCLMFKNINGCIINATINNIKWTLIDDQIVDSNLVKKLFFSVNKVSYTNEVKSNTINNASVGEVRVGISFPEYSLNDINNKKVSSDDKFSGLKVFVFWRNSFKYYPVEFRDKIRSHSAMMKEFNSLGSSKIQVFGCFLDDVNSLRDYIDVDNYSKISFITNASEWANDYLGIRTYITVVAVKNNVTVLREHYDNNKGDIEEIKNKLNEFL